MVWQHIQIAVLDNCYHHNGFIYAFLKKISSSSNWRDVLKVEVMGERQRSRAHRITHNHIFSVTFLLVVWNLLILFRFFSLILDLLDRRDEYSTVFLWELELKCVRMYCVRSQKTQHQHTEYCKKLLPWR